MAQRAKATDVSATGRPATGEPSGDTPPQDAGQAAPATAPAMPAPTAEDDVAALSFEAALAELEGIVKRLEEGDGQLDAAIAAYDRGVRLKQHCEAKLRDARMRIERIVGEGARQRAEPFDAASS